MFQKSARLNSEILLLIIVLHVIFFALSYVCFSQPVHDHVGYIEQWNTMLHGGTAYTDRTNAYGPGHAVLSLLYGVYSELPRLFFAISWLLTSLIVSLEIRNNPSLSKIQKYALYLLLLLNPLFWIFTVKFGTNDALMAFFVLFSMSLFFREKYSLSGVLMAIAISIKFIPAVMLPFLIFARKQVRWRYAISVSVTLVLIFGISYWLWGSESLHPLQMGYERKSSQMSVFRFLSGDYSPLRLFTDKPNLDWASTYIMLFAIGVFFWMHIKYQFEGILSSIIATGIIITFYKVGHHQFYITLIMLHLFWIGLNYKKETDEQMLLSMYIFITWISFISFLYDMTNAYKGTQWKEILGLPTFIISVWMIIQQIKYSLSQAGKPESSSG